LVSKYNIHQLRCQDFEFYLKFNGKLLILSPKIGDPSLIIKRLLYKTKLKSLTPQLCDTATLILENLKGEPGTWYWTGLILV